LCLFTVGYMVGVDGEVSLTWFGCAAGLLSSMLTALYSVLTAPAVAALRSNHMKLQFINNMMGIITLPIIAIATGEFEHASTLLAQLDQHFLILLLGSGILGGAMGVVTSLLVQFTTPLTQAIIGAAKSVAVGVIAVVVFKLQITERSWIATFLCTIAFSMYTYERTRVSNTEKNADNNKTRLHNKIATQGEDDDLPLVVKVDMLQANDQAVHEA